MIELSGIALTFIVITSFGISAMCSLVKSAQAHFSHNKLEAMMETKEAMQKLHLFLSRSDTVSIAITIVSMLAKIIFVVGIILLGNICISKNNFSLGIFIPLLPLVISAAIPEAIGRSQPERIMAWAIPFSSLLYWLLFWVVWPLSWLSQICEKFFCKYQSADMASAIEKEILQVVTEGQKEGVLQETQREMITGIMQLKDGEVREVMTPRTDMFCLPIDMSIQEAVDIINNKGHSRIPIYLLNRDDIVGILYIRDILKYWDAEKRNSLKIEEVMRKPYFIPETKHVVSLLQDFQKQKLHIAIVLDEYGGTAGIVTIEDIIEEIVGEILDEHDLEHLEPIRQLAENVLEVNGRVHVDELNEILEAEIPVNEGYDSIGGFLFSYMGRIPQQNESCRYKKLEFIIVDATERRINRIKIIKN